VRFEEVASNQLRQLSKSGNDLVIAYGETDTLTVKNHFSSAAYQIDRFEFSDGVTLTVPELYALYPLYLSASADSVTLTGAAETVYGEAGNDTIRAGDGNDTLYGGEGNDSLYGENGNDTLFGEAGNDVLYGGNGADRLVGGDGNDTLNGDADDDTLLGGDGNDSLLGGAGNDTLNGGLGNDTLDGGAGDDLYLLRVGAGQDTITNNDAAGIDTVRFEEVASNQLRQLAKSGNDLVIAYGETDTLTVKNHFSSAAYQIDRFEFSDGVTLTVPELYALYPLYLSASADSVTLTGAAETVYGEAGNDTIRAADGNDTVYGGEGNDSLYGGNGDDTLEGGLGNDTLNGEAGDDTLLGGDGNDSLLGGAGNDTLDGGLGNDALDGGAGDDLYLLRVGAGQDTITNNDAAGIDTVRFEEVASNQLRQLSKSGNDLVIAYGETDTLTVKNHFSGAAYQIDRFEFSDGVTLTVPELYAHSPLHLSASADSVTLTGGAATTVYGEAGNDTVRAADGNDTLYGGEGNDTLYGGNGDDTLEGGPGNDTLYGEAGNDTLAGGAGNDRLEGGSGNDTYLFGRGDGQDVIVDYDTSGDNSDLLSFAEGIAADQIWFMKSGNHLEVSIVGSGDKLTINNWYSNTAYRLEQFEDGNGATLSGTDVQTLVDAMANLPQPPVGAVGLGAAEYETLNQIIGSVWG
jgi:Ca2+-binding RTX toxin-like protein